MDRAKISTIPFGISFLDALASGILQQTDRDQFDLSDIKILLPTRRACRILRERFLILAGDQPLILPRLTAIGDVDSDELDIWLTAEIAPISTEEIPPAINGFERILLLASLIEKRADFKNQPVRAFALAQDLAALMDSVTIEGLSFENLHNIVPTEFAEHWQVTVQFLSILWQEWPKILSEHGHIEAAQRRNMLLDRLAQYWLRNPPQNPIIIAGVTGTIPATKTLMKSLLGCQKAHIILPGVDLDLDEESWDGLIETHPQFSLKSLLTHLGIERKTINLWQGQVSTGSQADLVPESLRKKIRLDREKLFREVMRPTHTSLMWQDLESETFKAGLQGLFMFEAQTIQQEARAIAVLLRETLETPGKTAALVTPDPALAKRVAGELSRWNIAIDNSAGRPASESTVGVFLQHILNAVAQKFSPTSLLGLLKHPLCETLNNTAKQRDNIYALDLSLRGIKPQENIDGLIRFLSAKNNQEGVVFIEEISKIFEPLLLVSSGTHPMTSLLQAHIKVAEKFGDLWNNSGGKEISDLFQTLLMADQNHLFLTLENYRDLINHILLTLPVRTVLEGHPRLAIFGQIEARILQYDRMILSGLNESVWPKTSKSDPWMSRPMRQAFGLPSSEIDIGLSALDFYLSGGAQEVLLTRSKRDGEAPLVASRWWQRLEVVLASMNIPTTEVMHPYLGDWLENLDHFDDKMTTLSAPEPRPPLSARPRNLSVTQIETLMRDPYALYAQKILNLKALDELEEPLSAKNRGIWLHRILHDFVKQYPEKLPPEGMSFLIEALDKTFLENNLDAVQKSFWRPKLIKALEWFIQHEEQWRENAKTILSEEKKNISFKCNGIDFTLEAKPDRIDRLNDGTLAIIDYKSSDPSTTKLSVQSGLTPQLSLEALIATKGGITGAPEAPSYLGYWVLSGALSEAGFEKIIQPPEDDMILFMENTFLGLKNLIEAFYQEETPYYSIPNPKNQPKIDCQNYRHLARIAEWSVVDQDSDE